MSDAQRPTPEQRPAEQGAPDPRYDIADAAEDTGAPEEEVIQAWVGAREDAEEAGLLKEPPADPRDLRQPDDILSFEEVANVDADDADAIGSDPDISGQEDIDAIDVDTDLDEDNGISTKDLGTHDGV